MKRWAVCAVAACILMLNFVPVVHAATLTASNAATLIAAINLANAAPDFDVIDLTGNAVFLTTNNITSGNNALPVINSDIRIDGNGLLISRDGALPPCDATIAPDRFRFFFVNSGTLHLNDVELSNGCSSGGAGGAISSAAGNLILTNVNAHDNQAQTDGGVIFTQGNLQVYGSTFTNNTASLGGSGGGAIALTAGTTALISGSLFTGNIANGVLGGGAVFSDGTITIRNSTFSNNQTSEQGGGVRLTGIAQIDTSTFNGNQADSGGGVSSRGFTTISNSTLSGNAAATLAGAMQIGSGTVNNITVLNNTALVTGGIATLTPSTLNNSIVAGNGITNCAGTFTGANNGSDNASCPGTFAVVVGTDVSAALANNGGSTQTHALLVGSVAENASGAGATAGDQRGTGANGVRDVGAFELTAFALPTISYDPAAAIILEAGGVVPMTLTSTARVVGQLLVHVFDTAGTATQGADYNSFFNTVVFDCDANVCDAGSPLTAFAVIFPTEDNLVEVDETLDLNMLVDGTAAGGGAATKQVTIRDFAEVSVTANVPNAVESPLTNGQFTVSLTTMLSSGATIPVINDTGTPIEVIYTVGGTATSATDYTPLTLTAIIPVGQSSVTVDVTPILDALADSGETVVVTLVCICIPAGLNITVITVPATVTILDAPAAPVVSAGGAGSSGIAFDPSINKIGFGRAGVGNQVEWRVTVSNSGAVAGMNVVVTDTLDSQLRIDRVDAPNATVTINGQTVTVVYPTLNVGASVTFNIFATVLAGDPSNTACVTADNQGAAECVTGRIVSQLPSTGETPLWHRWIILMVIVVAGGLFLRLVRIYTGHNRT